MVHRLTQYKPPDPPTFREKMDAFFEDMGINSGLGAILSLVCFIVACSLVFLVIMMVYRALMHRWQRRVNCEIADRVIEIQEFKQRQEEVNNHVVISNVRLDSEHLPYDNGDPGHNELYSAITKSYPHRGIENIRIGHKYSQWPARDPLENLKYSDEMSQNEWLDMSDKMKDVFKDKYI